MSTITVRHRTSYIVEHNGREFEVRCEPASYNDPIIEELPNGKTVIGYLSHDEDPINPRDNDNLGVMVCWHRRYHLGDKHHYQDPNALWADLLGEEYEKLRNLDEEDYATWLREHPALDWDSNQARQFRREQAELVARQIDERLTAKGYVVLPLFLYDHSGITISTGDFRHVDPDGWDSGQVGYVYTGPEEAQKVGVAPDNIKSALESEVTEYDDYLRGNVYGVCVDVFDAECNLIDENACWDHIGLDWAREELTSQVKYQVEHHTREP